MKSSWIILLATAVTGVSNAAETAEALPDQKAKVSYGIGMNLGTQFRRDGVDIDPALLERGLRDAISGQPTLLTPAEMQSILTEYSQQTRTRNLEQRREAGEKNRAEGERFLAENKTKPGVIALPSGLQYKVLTEGQGSSPASNDVVTVQYRGTLIDGTEFDSSYKRAEPATFPLNRVIRGWTEGLQLMKPGAKYQFFIPGQLAYGDRGMSRGGETTIGPNATLIFEVELISFEPAKPATTSATPAQAVTSDIIKVPSKEEIERGAQPEIIKKEDVDKLIEQERQKKQQQPQKPENK